LAVVDSDTCLRVEMEALQRWSFSAEDAMRIRQPVLSVIGEASGPIFDEIHSLLKQWIPRLEELAVPQANHALQYMNPGAVADGLAEFFDGHHL
jgi:pimeloyl-ACP methyl ester carboxylesterase